MTTKGLLVAFCPLIEKATRARAAHNQIPGFAMGDILAPSANSPSLALGAQRLPQLQGHGRDDD